MAIFRTGDMWSRFEDVDLFCFTANATIKDNGALVMGAGMAKQVRDRFTDIDIVIGQAIQDSHFKGELGLYPIYGFYVQKRADAGIGVFQVKRHFKQNAELSLIIESCLGLFGYLLCNPESKVVLNFPGIGYGGLSREEVLPIVSLLPDNVEIWESY